MLIELDVRPDDPSLAPLRDAWEASARRHADHDALARAALARYEALATNALPTLVREPLARIPSVARMLADRHWHVDPGARERFAGALGYFVDPDDLIPDHAGHFGYLDDALVLKLALAEARHEWFAWCDYSDYVAAHPDEAGIDRETWMQRRRERLDVELRRRNDQGYAASGRRDAGFVERYAPALETPARFGVR